MKKFILIVILLLPVNIYAKEYYTNYVYQKESNIKKEDTELLKVESKRLYANYQILKEDIGYQLKVNCHGHIDYDDHKTIKEYNKYDIYNSNETINAFLGRNDKIRYIILRNYPYKNQDKKIDIIYFGVFAKNEEISYEYLDNVIYKGEQYFFVLDLKKEYLIDELNIKIKYSDIFNEDFEYILDFSKEKTPPAKSYYYRVLTRQNSDKNDITFYNSDKFEEIVKAAPWLKSNVSDTALSYYYNEKEVYKCIKEEKVYSEILTENPPENYYQDKENYQDVYLYYKREIFDVKDEINSMEDYMTLINSSLPSSKYEIETNLDITKEGTYLIKIKYLNDVLYHKVNVNKKIINIPKEIVTVPKIITVEIDKPVIRQELIKKNVTQKITKKAITTKSTTLKSTKMTTNNEKVTCNEKKEGKVKSHLICILINILLVFVLIIQKIKTSFVESV